MANREAASCQGRGWNCLPFTVTAFSNSCTRARSSLWSCASQPPAIVNIRLTDDESCAGHAIRCSTVGCPATIEDLPLNPTLYEHTREGRAIQGKTNRCPQQLLVPPVHVPAPSPRQLDDPELFINRELSLLDFQRRVLEEAQDGSNPLLERLMFLSFVGSNVDEFFMVRVAGLKRQIEKGVIDTGPDGMSAAEQLRAIRASVIRLYRGAQECWSKELVPALESREFTSSNYADLTRRAARARRFLFSGDRLPHPHSAGLRSRPPVPAHLQPQPESGGALASRRRRRAFRARQDSRHAAAAGSGERCAQGQKPREDRRSRNSASSGWSSWSSPTWGRFSRAWRSSRRIPSMSRATPTARSRTWKPAICWSRWKKACGSAVLPMSCAWKSTRPCPPRSSTSWSKTWNSIATTSTS